MSPTEALWAVAIGLLIGGALTTIYVAMLWHWRNPNDGGPK